jgi:hypothetical protein
VTSAQQNQSPIAAGPFGAWLKSIRASLRGDVGTDVPCGDCVGCCISSYFIPIRPCDQAAINVIPKELLVAAPGQPNGHTMLGYREDGACPMLNNRQCSIYEHRPQTCRDYDCRIFAAAGIDAGGTDKSTINMRVRAWRFTYESESARLAHEAVLAASKFIREEGASFPNRRVPTAATGIAVLAVKTYTLFMTPSIADLDGREIAEAIIRASGEFDAGLADE